MKLPFVIRTTLLVILLVTARGAFAVSVHVNFAGAFDRMTYAPCLTQLSSGDCSEYDSSFEIDATTFFLGIPLSVGDAFSGSLSYGAEDGFVFSDNGTTVDYRNTIVDAMFISGLLELPRPELEVAFWELGNFVAVTNGTTGSDDIFFLQVFYSQEWRGTLTFSLTDFSGEVFSDTELPATLDLADFSTTNFRLALTHLGGNGDTVNVFGTLSSVDTTPVPIPAAGLLLLTACAGLLLGKSRGKSVRL